MIRSVELAAGDSEVPGGLRNNNSPHESHFQAFQDAPSESKNNEKTQKSSRTRTVTPLPRMPGLRPSSSYAADAPSRDAGSPSELLLAIDALRSPHHCTPTAASHCPCARISCTPLSRPGLAPAWASGGRWWSCSPRSIAHRHLAPAIASSPLGLPGECGRGGLPTCEALRNALFSATTRVNPSPPSTLKLPQSLGPITEEYLGAFYEDS